MTTSMGSQPLGSTGLQQANFAASTIPLPSSENLIGMMESALDCGAALMLRVKHGDSISFSLLLKAHRAPVTHFLYRMVQEHVIAEELAQEVFLRVYRSRDTYQATARFTTWLFRIARHLALNWLRDQRHERAQKRLDDNSPEAFGLEISDPRPSVEQQLVHEARLREVRRAVAALPGNQRAAVLMHKYEEMDYSQIAKVLGCSESAVKSLLFRAYETLRARLSHFR